MVEDTIGQFILLVFLLPFSSRKHTGVSASLRKHDAAFFSWYFLLNPHSPQGKETGGSIVCFQSYIACQKGRKGLCEVFLGYGS